MRSKHLLLMLLLALMAPWAVAQQALPYSYGFEDNDLSADGWTAQVSSSFSGISSYAAHDGDYGFQFSYSEDPGYLVSPLLTGGTNGVDVSFWYCEYDDYYGNENFQVGYTTDATNTDPSTYTYEDVTEASMSWQQYQTSFPAGTVRVAIKYIYTDAYYLYLDDFSFEAVAAYPKPKQLAVAGLSSTSAKLSWTAPNNTVTNYKYQYKATTSSTWSTETTVTATSANISGLTEGTSYDFRVKATYSVNSSDYATTTFTTFTPQPIPYAYGFEDAGEVDPHIETIWTVTGEAIDPYTGAHHNNFFTSGDVARTGDYYFLFSSYNLNPTPVQYLISPELSGITNGLHVEFYYKKIGSGEETFHVGYSTTDNAPTSFTWSTEYTATESYQKFSANYPAETRFVAVKYTSDYQYYLPLDDFLFEESASCVEPGDVMYANVTADGADISWTPVGSETAWDLYVTDKSTNVPVDATTPTYPNITTNPYPLTGLTSATTYYVYVRARCSSSDHSAWSVPAVFNTECEAMALPYSYDFEEDALSVCWSTINPNTSFNSITISTADPQTGSKHLDLRRGSSEGIQIVVLPEVDDSYALNEYEVTLYAKLYSGSGSYDYGRTLAIGVMTDPADASTFVQVGDAFTPTTDYVQYKVRLNTYTGDGQYIAIKHASTAYGNTFVDNLVVKAIPNCIEPSDPVVSNITNHAAKLDWEGTSASYNVDYRTAAYLDGIDEGFEGGSLPAGWTHIGNGIITFSNSSSYVHTGTYSLKFSGATSNNVVVLPALSKELKAMGGLSFWSLAESSYSSGTFQVGYVTDATDVSTFNQVASFDASAHTAYTHVENVSFASAPNGARLAFRHTSGSDYYYWWIDDISMGEEVPAGEWQHTTSTTNTKTLESLLASRKYDVRVQGNCGSETSEWSGIVSFTTDIPCPAPTGLAASNATSSSFDLSWTNGGSEDWIVAYKTSTDANFTEVGVNMTEVTEEAGLITYTLGSLEAEKEYTVKVRDNCEPSYAGDGVSDWTTEVVYSTVADCSALNPVVSNITHYTATVNWDGESTSGFTVKYRTSGAINPDDTELEEGFEHDGEMPTNWTHIGNGSLTISNTSSRVHTGSYSLRFSGATSDNVVVLPELGVEANTMLISFWSLAESSTSSGTFQVGYVTDAEDASTFHTVGNYEAKDQLEYTHVENVSLASAPANARIAFRHTSAVTSYWWWIDDVVIGAPAGTGTWQDQTATTTTADLTGLTAGTNYDVKVVPNCNETHESATVQFTTVYGNIKRFITEGNWGTAANWMDNEMPTITDNAELRANATITGDAAAKKITINSGKTLTIEGNGSLQTDNTVTATVKKSITGYTGSKDHYYLIGNPLSSNIYVYNPDNTYNIRKGTYDLYNWSRTSELEWRYYGAENDNTLTMYPGTGYLYANAADVELTFTGTVFANNIPLSSYVGYTEPTAGTTDFSDWNLLANPFVCDAYLVDASENGNALPYYKMNDAGDGFTAVSNGAAVAPMQGIFYKATAAGNVYCTRTAPGAKGGQLNMNLRSGSKQLDNAIVAFGSEQKLEKFSFRANSSKIYMPVEGKDYAITNAEPQGEMPVSFKAEKNGSYTLSFNTENVEFGYLHLIDNMTGEDVNLLETPSYSFEAKTTDYASRFRLVFSTGNGVNEESFAFISDGNIILNGEGMLQVVDVMGRIMMQEENATSVSTNGMTPGVYVLRLINGDSVRTQKIVIK